MKLKISYKNEEVKEFYKNCGVKTDGSIGFDICAIEDIEYFIGDIISVDFGIIIKPPKGYHFEILPRSSIFKKGLFLTNSIGLIDQDYCGKNDFIGGKFYCFNHFFNDYKGMINKGERLAQLVLRKSNLITEIEEFEPKDKNRGGFGSTGA